MMGDPPIDDMQQCPECHGHGCVRVDYPTEAEKLRKILLQFVASLALCDHMGDVSNDVADVLKKLDMEPPEEVDYADDWFYALGTWLGKQGITTLNGTRLGQDG